MTILPQPLPAYINAPCSAALIPTQISTMYFPTIPLMQLFFLLVFFLFLGTVVLCNSDSLTSLLSWIILNPQQYTSAVRQITRQLAVQGLWCSLTPPKTLIFMWTAQGTVGHQFSETVFATQTFFPVLRVRLFPKIAQYPGYALTMPNSVVRNAVLTQSIKDNHLIYMPQIRRKIQLCYPRDPSIEIYTTLS